MSVELLELACVELEPFLDEVAFVGGATIGLWITDPAGPEPRATEDVDLVVEVTSRLDWHRFEERLRAHGLREDQTSKVICRWRTADGSSPLVVDVLPRDPSILGFGNRWLAPALDHALWRALPSGRRLRAIAPPYLLATKLEAWLGRGEGDHLRSRDLEDIAILVDGREELVHEVADADEALKTYVSQQLKALLDEPRFIDLLDGTIGVGGGSGSGSGDVDRVEEIVLPRLREMTP